MQPSAMAHPVLLRRHPPAHPSNAPSLLQGIRLGVSSRGWASLVQDPTTLAMHVDEDFELITFDFVTEPSTRGAFLVPLCSTYRSAGLCPVARALHHEPGMLPVRVVLCSSEGVW